MRTLTGILLLGGLLFAASFATAQRPGEERSFTKSADADDLVARMMEFDKDKDGKLTKLEVTDARLHRLFDRADADKDGSVTKAELVALAEKEHPEGRGGPGFGPPGGPGGPGGPMMGMFRPGEVLPRGLQMRLRLTPEQRTKVDDLQKEVDGKLEKILDEEQQQQLKEMRDRGPGGFGPPGGRRGGPGGPGGPPPGGGPGGPPPGGPEG